jgi:hypothetical protein
MSLIFEDDAVVKNMSELIEVVEGRKQIPNACELYQETLQTYHDNVTKHAKRMKNEPIGEKRTAIDFASGIGEILVMLGTTGLNCVKGECNSPCSTNSILGISKKNKNHCACDSRLYDTENTLFVVNTIEGNELNVSSGTQAVVYDYLNQVYKNA